MFSLFTKTPGYPVSRLNKSWSIIQKVYFSYDFEVHSALRGSFFFILNCLHLCILIVQSMKWKKYIKNISIFEYFLYDIKHNMIFIFTYRTVFPSTEFIPRHIPHNRRNKNIVKIVRIKRYRRDGELTRLYEPNNIIENLYIIISRSF